MIAVAGAAIVLSTLPGWSRGRSFSFASVERTKTIRIGDMFAEVGPIFARSYAWRRSASSTGLSCQAICVRASRKIRSRAAESSVFIGSSPNREIVVGGILSPHAAPVT